MKQFILTLTILALMLAITIVYQTPDMAAGEIILEYKNEPEAVETVSEDNEVDFENDFEYYKWLVSYAAELNGIDPELATAISRLETGNWTSDVFVDGHNFGGLTGQNGPYSYQYETEGLEAFMKCLKWYQNNGMDTPEKMAKVYCPANDRWPELVRQLMKEGKT